MSAATNTTNGVFAVRTQASNFGDSVVFIALLAVMCSLVAHGCDANSPLMDGNTLEQCTTMEGGAEATKEGGVEAKVLETPKLGERGERDQSIRSLEGLWVSHPQRSEWGPAFAELTIQHDGNFEWRLFVRTSTDDDVRWTGSLILAGRIDLANRDLVADGKFNLDVNGPGLRRIAHRWTCVLKDAHEMKVKHLEYLRDDFGSEETREENVHFRRVGK